MQSPLQLLSVEQYLAAEAESEIRHEYVAGQIFAMAGASEEHNLIAGNIYSRLRSHLRGTGCRVFISDMKVKIKINPAQIFYYPDLFVTCNSEDNQRYFKTEPCLIIEILSKHTQTIDQREKRINYQSLESLQEYVLISPTQIKIELYHRHPRGDWELITLGQEDVLELESVGLTLTMADIYEDVIAI